jgi:hypothetical protein
MERMRDFLTAPPREDYFAMKAAEGWKLVAIEWERGAERAPDETEEIPYGLRVTRDLRRLEPDPGEVEVLMLMKEVILQDGPLSRAAQLINSRGHRTRAGKPWSAVGLFELLPRLIDMGPRLNKSPEWAERRQRIAKAG